MTKQEIADLIRNEYDPKPSHWKIGESGWDDGADTIAEAVHAEIKYLRDGLRQIADAARDGANHTWIVSAAMARLRGEVFVELPTT